MVGRKNRVKGAEKRRTQWKREYRPRKNTQKLNGRPHKATKFEENGGGLLGVGNRHAHGKLSRGALREKGPVPAA